MNVTLPYRADPSLWPAIAPNLNIHVAIERFYDALVESIQGTKPGRLMYFDLPRQYAERKLSTGQWAILLEGPLKGEILNGGLEQYLGNNPGIVAETQKFLDRFAPKDMAAAYAKVTDGLTQALTDLSVDTENPDWEALDGCFEDWTERAIVAEVEDFDIRYVGKDSFDDARLDAPTEGEGWAGALARNVLRYCLDHPEDFIKR